MPGPVSCVHLALLVLPQVKLLYYNLFMCPFVKQLVEGDFGAGPEVQWIKVSSTLAYIHHLASARSNYASCTTSIQRLTKESLCIMWDELAGEMRTRFKNGMSIFLLVLPSPTITMGFKCLPKFWQSYIGGINRFVQSHLLKLNRKLLYYAYSVICLSAQGWFQLILSSQTDYAFTGGKNKAKWVWFPYLPLQLGKLYIYTTMHHRVITLLACGNFAAFHWLLDLVTFVVSVIATNEVTYYFRVLMHCFYGSATELYCQVPVRVLIVFLTI